MFHGIVENVKLLKMPAEPRPPLKKIPAIEKRRRFYEPGLKKSKKQETVR